MKNPVVVTLCVCILVFSAINAWKDDVEMLEHHEFFLHVENYLEALQDAMVADEKFRNKGARFTRNNGMTLCEEQQRIQNAINLPVSKCDF